MKKLLILFFALFVSVSAFSGSVNICQANEDTQISVKEFGAKGDGITNDTKAVQAAIDKCSSEGKKVVFPAGTFMTGTIFLRSNTDIELTAKAIWKGIGDVDAYPMQHPAGFEGRAITQWRALIYADGQENISISGQGMIYGNGEHKAFQFGIGDNDGRPFGLWIVRCRNFKIEGIQMRNSAFWMQQYEECDHLVIKGIRVFNHANYNNDGLDITDCHDVIVSDCVIDSSDDALCPKSHGLRGVSDLVVTNCILASHADAFKLGTLSRGGFRRITVNNLVIRPSKASHVMHPMKMNAGLSGIDLMSSDGGIMEDITIQNVVMDSIETPITLKLGDRWAGRRRNDTSRVSTGTPGIARNIFIGNVIIKHAGPIPCLITGYPGHYIENITLSNIRVEVEGGLPAQDVFVPENSGSYPFNRMFGLKNPAYGFFIRHAKNVQFRDVQITTARPDDRRAIVFSDATGVLENIDIVNSGGQGRPSVLVDNEMALELRGTNHGLKVQTGNVLSQPPVSSEKMTGDVSPAKPEIVKDYDGNQYKTVKIGNQLWLSGDLKTTHYNDGKSIPLVTDDNAWSKLTTPGYCWFRNTEENKEMYGALYNWYAVSSGNLCPKGWHIPSEADWKDLATSFDRVYSSGGDIKPVTLTASSGITRHSEGGFFIIGGYNYWWTIPGNGNYDFLHRGTGYYSGTVYRLHKNKNYGFAVRCLKD